MTEISMAVSFKTANDDVAETIYLRDRDLIKQIPVLVRSIESEHPDWLTAQVETTEPMEIPFPKASGEFIFAHLRKYEAPDPEKEDPQLEDYAEANKFNLTELKEVLELANFMECTPFMHCIGFVVAKKLEEKTVEEIAAYFGVECKPEGHFFDEADGWIHPPSDIFENRPNAAGPAPGPAPAPGNAQ